MRAPPTLWAVTGLLLTALLLAGEGTLLGDLEELADWCAKAKLYRARQEVSEAILHVDPDHAEARKWLKYRRAKDGTWERSKNFKPARDLASKRRPEFEARRRGKHRRG